MKKASWISLSLALAIGIILFACSNSDEATPGVSSDSSGGDGEYSSDDNSNPGNSSPTVSSSSPTPTPGSSAKASSSSTVASPCVQPMDGVPTGGITSCIIVNGKCYTCNPDRGNECNQSWVWKGEQVSDTHWYKEVSCGGSVNPGASSSSKPASSSSAGGGSSSGSSGGTANTGTPVAGGKSGSGWASRYWDGCKPSCGWSDNAGGNPTKSCGNDGTSILSDNDAQNICMQGGPAHTCYSQAPWQVTDQVAYGFAASHTNGDCGKCFRLTFKGTTQHAANSNALNHIKGKIMVVKISNIGGDVGGNQLDLMIPGGGLGAFDGFTMQTGVNGSVLKASAGYGGFVTDCGGADEGNGALSTLQTCVKNKCTSAFTNANLKAGCDLYADWAGAANNPQFDFVEVSCPSELNSKW